MTLYQNLTAAALALGLCLGAANANAEEPKEKPQQDYAVKQFEENKKEYNSADTCVKKSRTVTSLGRTDLGRKFLEERMGSTKDLEEMMAIVDGHIGSDFAVSDYKKLRSDFLKRFADALYTEKQKLEAEDKEKAGISWFDLFKRRGCEGVGFQSLDCLYGSPADCGAGHEKASSASKEFIALCDKYKCGFFLGYCENYGCIAITCKPDTKAKDFKCNYVDYPD